MARVKPKTADASEKKEQPKAFQRNYAVRSIGAATRSVVEVYVSKQPDRHPMADAHVQSLLRQYQNTDPGVDSRQEPDTPLAHPLQKRRSFRGAKVDHAKSIAIRVLFCLMRAPCAHHCCSCLRRESSRHGVTGNYGLPAKPAPSCTCVSPEYQPCSGSGWRDP